MRILAPITALAFTTAALAVTTSHWTHTSEADFAAGEMQAVVATNLGDLKLSRSVKSILQQDARVSAVHALAEGPDGAIYAATGPQGLLLQINADKVSDAAQFGDNTSLFSLLVDRDGRVLVGTGGERGEIYRVDKPGEKPQKIFSADGVQYIWAMTQASDGTLYAATGPTGQLHAITPDGKSTVLFDSDENNLLCLAGDGGDLLYAGTDPKGLVLRINRRTGQAFVVYDAPESEVSALLRTRNGDLLAATAQATPEGEFVPPVATEQTGRPETTGGAVPIQATPPETPKPPELPEPPPTEPKPIPKFLLQVPDDGPATEPAAEVAGANVPPARSVVPGVVLTPATEGNAVYRIDADGFVTQLFRGNVAVFAMLEQADEILLATGSEGMLYQLRPTVEENVVLANVDPKQVLSMLQARDGRVYLGCANRGDISVVTSSFADLGTYTSPVLDAGQISRFGALRLRGSLPDRTTLKLATRSGNVSDPAGSGWSDWTAPVDAVEFSPVTSPPARFFQYRLEFTSVGGQTPVVQDVDVAYQLPNLSPQVTAVRIAEGDTASPDTRPKRTISWDAADANADTLQYAIQYRTLPGGEWITIKDKLADATFEWDTRTVADGRYELRITASDATGNAPGTGKSSSRVSDALVVDNTPPVIGDVAAGPVANGSARVEFTVIDRTGTVQKLEYTLDGRDDWQTALPSDTITDSPKEAYALSVNGLKDGPHHLALRATDSSGNQTFLTVALK